ncbi:MAG: putative intraflagellar transport protein 88, partial [Streblomastix strix]
MTARPPSGEVQRPMTSVKGAGFTSRPLTGSGGGTQMVGLQSLTTDSLFHEQLTPEEIASNMEKEINELVEESATAALTNISSALIKAKEAARLVEKLQAHKAQAKLGDPINAPLRFLVYFNLSTQLEANQQNDKALRTYQMMVKEFENTPHATRIRVNMGNIYYKEKNYGNAMRMYQMALDNVSETNRIYRHWIRRNMAYTQLVQHQYDAAM